MATFDLRYAPWIPVVRPDGTQQELSLRAVLEEAHLLSAIRDPFPTVEFGLYRLLTALVLDIFHPQDTLALQELLAEGRFDSQQINAYFIRYEDRFDLFHPKFPFLQTAGMEGETAKPLAGLLPPIPSGTNSVHFHHAHEDVFAASPAVAARLLTTIAPFMTAGGAGLSPSINGAPPWYVWISRPISTLFEAICLNCCVVHLPQAVPPECPAWRAIRPVTNERRTEASLLESLTWQPRRIQLIPGESGLCSLTCSNTPNLVSTMKFSPGFGSGFAAGWTDPAVPYRLSDKGPTPLRPQEGREVWRDTGPVALLRRDESNFARPLIVDQFEDLVQNKKIFRDKKAITVNLYGMRTDMKMKVFEWQHECLVLPIELIWQRRAHLLAQEAMERAEKAAYALKQAIKRVYPREGKGNKGAFDTLITGAEQQFWSSLRQPYEEFLREIAPLSPEDDVEQINVCKGQWEKQMRSAGWKSLGDAIEDLDTNASALKRCVEARRFFAVSLNKIFTVARA